MSIRPNFNFVKEKATQAMTGHTANVGGYNHAKKTNEVAAIPNKTQ